MKSLNRSHILAMSLFACSLPSVAQTIENPMDSVSKPFSHLQVGINAGTTGFGVEVTMPVNNNVRVRAGFNVMPKITLDKGYEMSVEGDGLIEDTEYRTNHLLECLTDLAGTPIDGTIHMLHNISFHNARVLVDWYPFKEKHWHFTGGFYYGPKSIGKAINAKSESNTMVAINRYNQMRDMVENLDDFEYPSFKLGNHYYELDPESGNYMKRVFMYYGRLSVKMGDFPDGTPHYIYPDEDGLMQAYPEAWAFKPYIGGGWSTNFGYDKRWMFGVEAGAMIWGRPHVYCNDGVDLISDVKNIGGEVGDYIKLLKNMPFCPNIEVRVAYTFF